MLSVVVVAYDMARELPRTLHTLGTSYQRGHPRRRLRGDRRRQRLAGAGPGRARRRRSPGTCASSGSIPRPVARACREPRARRRARRREGTDRRRCAPRLTGPARRCPRRGPARRAARGHGAGVPSRGGTAHARRRGRVRPVGGGHAVGRVRVARTTATACSGSAPRPGRPGEACSVRWARAAACSRPRSSGTSWAAWTSASPSRRWSRQPRPLPAGVRAAGRRSSWCSWAKARSTSTTAARPRRGRFGWDEMQADYTAIRGVPHRPPRNPRRYVGRVPTSALGFVESSARQAREHAGHADDW